MTIPRHPDRENTGVSPVKPCIKCGACNRNKRGECKPCSTATTYARRAKNPERKKAIDAKWYAGHPEKISASKAAWYAANTEAAKKKSATWYALNKDKASIARSAWRVANLDRVKESNSAWVAANPEAVKAHKQNRRSRKLKAGGKLSVGIAKKLFVLQRGKCTCCGLPLGDNYHIDHIMPLALGGTNTDDNVQLLRQRCNNQKYAKHPVDFMQQRGFLL